MASVASRYEVAPLVDGLPFGATVSGLTLDMLTDESTRKALYDLWIDKGVTFADLKGTLGSFIRQVFDSSVKLRFRPSFFPFVEPGVEVDMMLKGSDSKLANKWIEIMGAGMVHPKVLKDSGIDPAVFSGFAFGMGIDRLAVMKYGINDVRDLYTGDLRFVSQF